MPPVNVKVTAQSQARRPRLLIENHHQISNRPHPLIVRIPGRVIERATRESGHLGNDAQIQIIGIGQDRLQVVGSAGGKRGAVTLQLPLQGVMDRSNDPRIHRASIERPRANWQMVPPDTGAVRRARIFLEGVRMLGPLRVR